MRYSVGIVALTASQQATSYSTPIYREVLELADVTIFTGYTEVARQSTINAILDENGVLTEARAGDHIEVVLDYTPFFPTTTSHQGDLGVMKLADGSILEVISVHKPIPDLIAHRVHLLAGQILTGVTVYPQVNIDRRRAIARAHSGAHLLQQALLILLGSNCKPQLTAYGPHCFSIDITTDRPLTPDLLVALESSVNDVVLADVEVKALISKNPVISQETIPYECMNVSANSPRLIAIGDYSYTYCEGTHVAHSANIGMVKIISQRRIGNGQRRLEALVATAAFQRCAQEHTLVARLLG